MTKIIEIKNLARYFKQYQKQPGLKGSIKSLFSRDHKIIKAVDDISFSIEPGERVGFIGPNGAGKTTTLKMLSGLLHPTSGELQVLGYQPFKRQDEFKRKFSIVLGQKSQLWWDLPAIESIRLNKYIYEIPEEQFKKDLDELAEIMEIKDILNVQVRKLSLGQRMKCELIASIIHRPQIMFLDEPTIGLDVVMQKRIRDFFKEYNQKYGTTLLLTSHYMDDVKEVCERLIIINKGQLVYDGGLETLIKQYAKNKFLKIVFDQEIKREDLEMFGDIQELNGYTVTLSVPREEHTDIAATIMKKFKIDDLDIQEQKLEDIIRVIFSEKQ
jgi:ABC-2 type transport system ATP-binding protein